MNSDIILNDASMEGSQVIEILVQEGDEVKQDDPLIVLESDKASMEYPSPQDGTVKQIAVKVGDAIQANHKIMTLDVADVVDVASTVSESSSQPTQSSQTSNDNVAPSAEVAVATSQESQSSASSLSPSSANYDYQVCVIGGGPGGYTSAFRAADLGLKVVVIERYPVLGGVCLNVGCIPSKTLLHSAQVLEETKHMEEQGITFSGCKVDIDKLREHKQSVTNELNQGLAKIAEKRQVTIIQGNAQLADKHSVEVTDNEGNKQTISAENMIIAVGSRVTKLPFIPEDENIWDSTDALELRKIPSKMLILGGGIIGLEMACVYHALGAEITVVELSDQIIPEADKDIILPLQKKILKQYKNLFLRTKVTKLEPFKKGKKSGVEVYFEGKKCPEKDSFDTVLVAVGRSPNGKLINAEAAGVEVGDNGFIAVNAQQQTNVPNIYAIGDVVGQPMLAHKATHQGKVAAEVISGIKQSFSPMTIPAVAYTQPEVAWMGKTEKQLKAEKIDYVKGMFPWQASGRALAAGGGEGMSKALFCSETHRLLGAAMTGINAGELISEAVLALEMGAEASDIGLTIHPHPTLAETFAMCAEAAEGTITDVLPPKKILTHSAKE